MRSYFLYDFLDIIVAFLNGDLDLFLQNVVVFLEVMNILIRFYQFFLYLLAIFWFFFYILIYFVLLK